MKLQPRHRSQPLGRCGSRRIEEGGSARGGKFSGLILAVQYTISTHKKDEDNNQNQRDVDGKAESGTKLDRVLVLVICSWLGELDPRVDAKQYTYKQALR